jgi:hypothetical protein
MMDDDHYDLDEVFGADDLVDHARPASRAETVASVRRVIQQAQRSRLPPPAITITSAPRGARLGEVQRYDVLGAALGLITAEDTAAATPAPFTPTKPAPFTPVESSQYPIVQQLHRKFKSAMPSEKVVRVDTEESYSDFMADRRAPYVAALEARLADLERAVQVHTADNHGGGKLEALEQRTAGIAEALAAHLEHGDHAVDVMGAEVEAAREQAALGGTRVPLSLAPWAEGKIDCWRDGDEIYCSVRLPGPDGRVRIATTTTPVAKHVDEVLSYAEDAGVDSVDLLGGDEDGGVLHGLAEILGGGALVTQICRAAPCLLERPEVAVQGSGAGAFVGVVTPVGDPGMAAAMALLQLCQKPGASDACFEVEALKKTPAGAKLIAEAQKRLTQAQADMPRRGR